MKRVKISDFNLTELREGKFRVETFRLTDGSMLTLPCGILSNSNDSNSPPITCIVGGQHGNEWNGIYISQKIFKEMKNKEIRGTLIVLPILNPLAFNQKSRVSNIDNIDLNRTYLSNSYRKPTEILGKLLFENIFSKMDYIVDIHTGGPGEYFPHVAVQSRERVISASLIFPNIIKTSGQNGSLVSSSEKRNINSYLIEIGKGRDINYEYTNKAIKGLKNFFKGINLYKGKINRNKEEIFENKEKISSPISGFLETNLDLGDYVDKNEKIGEIERVLGESVEVKSPVSGKIMYLRKEKAVSEGESIAYVFW